MSEIFQRAGQRIDKLFVKQSRDGKGVESAIRRIDSIQLPVPTFLKEFNAVCGLRLYDVRYLSQCTQSLVCTND